MIRPLIVAGSTALLVILVVADWGGPLRVAATFWFLLACPGLAWAPLVANRVHHDELALVLAISVALDIVVVTLLLVVGLLSAAGSLIILGALCATGCALQLGRP